MDVVALRGRNRERAHLVEGGRDPATAQRCH
jgi:hypothetical protein